VAQSARRRKGSSVGEGRANGEEKREFKAGLIAPQREEGGAEGPFSRYLRVRSVACSPRGQGWRREGKVKQFAAAERGNGGERQAEVASKCGGGVGGGLKGLSLARFAQIIAMGSK